MKYGRRIHKFFRKAWLTLFAIGFGLWLGVCVWFVGAAGGPVAVVWWWVARIPNIWRYDGIARRTWRNPFRRKVKA